MLFNEENSIFHSCALPNDPMNAFDSSSHHFGHRLQRAVHGLAHLRCQKRANADGHTGGAARRPAGAQRGPVVAGGGDKCDAPLNHRLQGFDDASDRGIAKKFR
jgi:hypothetical protein